MTLKNRVDRVQHQMDQTDAQRAESLLRGFVDGLAPEHRAILRDILGDPALDDLDISDQELDRLLLGSLSDDTLALLLRIAARHALPGHLADLDSWQWNLDDWPPGPNGPAPLTPEARALSELKCEIMNAGIAPRNAETLAGLAGARGLVIAETPLDRLPKTLRAAMKL